jgi:hypothetical protein
MHRKGTKSAKDDFARRALRRFAVHEGGRPKPVALGMISLSTPQGFT